MKRTLCLILALVMLLALSGCQSKEAKAADALISAIGEVTLESEDAIREAEKAVALLTEDDKASLEKYVDLTVARETYDALVKEAELSEEAAKAEEAIRAIGTVTADSDTVVSQARAVYDGISAEARERVSNAEVLTLAEDELKAAHIQRVKDLVDNFGEVTADSKDKIDEIMENINALSEEELALYYADENAQKFMDIGNQYWDILGESLIHVDKIAVSKPDSAGGVMVYFNFTNKSEKTIKYITFGYSFYNTVGDLVRGKYDRSDVCYGKVTGPYATGQGLQGTRYYWGKHYGSDLSSIKLVYLAIEYTDGSTMQFSDRMLEAAQK